MLLNGLRRGAFALLLILGAAAPAAAMNIERVVSPLGIEAWLVQDRLIPVVAVEFAGADRARPAPGVLEAIDAAETILVCPSNPIISIGPILAVPGVREALWWVTSTTLVLMLSVFGLH